MKFKHAIGSLRHHGFRGAVNFALDIPKKWNLRRKLAKTLIADPTWKPTPGVTVISNLSRANSLSSDANFKKSVESFLAREF